MRSTMISGQRTGLELGGNTRASGEDGVWREYAIAMTTGKPRGSLAKRYRREGYLGPGWAGQGGGRCGDTVAGYKENSKRKQKVKDSTRSRARCVGDYVWMGRRMRAGLDKREDRSRKNGLTFANDSVLRDYRLLLGPVCVSSPRGPQLE